MRRVSLASSHSEHRAGVAVGFLSCHVFSPSKVVGMEWVRKRRRAAARIPEFGRNTVSECSGSEPLSR